MGLSEAVGAPGVRAVKTWTFPELVDSLLMVDAIEGRRKHEQGRAEVERELRDMGLLGDR